MGRAIGREQNSTVVDLLAFPIDQLANDPVFANEKTSFR
jgi:hypothetical protein